MDDNIIDFTKKTATSKEEKIEETIFEITFKDPANHEQILVEQATGVWYETSAFVYVIEPMTEKTRMLVPVFGVPAHTVLKVTKVANKAKMN